MIENGASIFLEVLGSSSTDLRIVEIIRPRSPSSESFEFVMNAAIEPNSLVISCPDLVDNIRDQTESQCYPFLSIYMT